jgi:hypothetical protein
LNSLFTQLIALTRKENAGKHEPPPTIQKRSKALFAKLEALMRRNKNVRRGSYYWMLKWKKRGFYKLENGVFKRDLLITERMYVWMRTARLRDYARNNTLQPTR